MSRDLTPRELWLLSEHNRKNGRPTLLDTLKNTTVTYNGETFPYRTADEISVIEQYPLLGTLLDSFLQLHKDLSGLRGGLEFLSEKEQELGDYIAGTRENCDPTLSDWFEGRLDPAFYYSIRNDELFSGSLLSQAKTRVRGAEKASLGSQIESAASRTGVAVGTRKACDLEK